MYSRIIFLIILILVNAFFAASEIALVSLNENIVRKRAENGNKKAKMLVNLLNSPGRFLATIQIGITLAGFLASAFAAESFARPLSQSLHSWGVPLSLTALETISVIAITIILSYFTLVIGELVPKQLALKKSEAIANFSVYPLTILFKISFPFVLVLNKSTNLIVRLFGVDPNAQNEEATEENIRMMIDVGKEHGTIMDSEKTMINKIFEFNDKMVSDIMTHRTDITALSSKITFSELADLISKKRFTRFPVYENNMDNIIGILHTKDLIQFLDKGKENFDIKAMLKKPYFVLGTQRIDAVLDIMQKNNVHIAIVVDEYGGTDGIVTIEDMIEEIIGEIYSEHSNRKTEKAVITKIDNGKYIISGTMNLFQFEDHFNVKVDSEAYDTLNGFLVGQLGYLPKKDEKPTVKYKKMKFEIIEVSDKKIEKIKLTLE